MGKCISLKTTQLYFKIICNNWTLKKIYMVASLLLVNVRSYIYIILCLAEHFSKNIYCLYFKQFFFTWWEPWSSAAVPNLVPAGIFCPPSLFKMPARLNLNIVFTIYLIKHQLLCHNATLWDILFACRNVSTKIFARMRQRLDTPDLVVKAEDSWTRGRGFEPRHRILDECKRC